MSDQWNPNPQSAEDVTKNILIEGDARARNRGYVEYFNPKDLVGRALGIGGIGLILGMVGGAFDGSYNHNLIGGFLFGAAKGFATGAAVGVVWHIVMTIAGGVSSHFRGTAISNAARYAIGGAIAGFAWAVLSGRANNPLPTVLIFAAIGAALGFVRALLSRR